LRLYQRGHLRTVSRQLLGIYLSDHQAGSTLGIELAKRSARNNRGTETGRALQELAGEIEADRDVLERLMRQLGVEGSRVKRAGAWAAEKVGRLKLNGHLLSYSPLSRLQELEGLSLGIAGKQALWEALANMPESDDLRGFEFDQLAERARMQRETVESLRLTAAEEALRPA